MKFPGPFLAGNCAESRIYWVPIRRGGSEDLHRQGWKIVAENRMLTDGHRRYFSGFVLIDVNAGRQVASETSTCEERMPTTSRRVISISS